MNQKGAVDDSVFPKEETERRLTQYRDEAFKRKAMLHIIYHNQHVLCPWPGCGYKIAGIDFQLEKLNDPNEYNRLLSAWWQGQGLVGRCPGCGQYVLFGMAAKRAVADPIAAGLVMLADDWQQNAYLI
jgi:hypothetical protein